MIIEFVPYHLALELKQLGFDKECSGYYDVDNGYTAGYAFCYSDVETQPEKGCSAPLYQQAFRWFREKHGLDYEITSAGKKGEYHSFVHGYVYGNNGSSPSVFSYEEAELACLKKLIEIANTKEK
jgi:hypothetical protein